MKEGAAYLQIKGENHTAKFFHRTLSKNSSKIALIFGIPFLCDVKSKLLCRFETFKTTLTIFSYLSCVNGDVYVQQWTALG